MTDFPTLSYTSTSETATLNIPEPRKRYPFWVEYLRKVLYREYRQPPPPPPQTLLRGTSSVTRELLER